MASGRITIPMRLTLSAGRRASNYQLEQTGAEFLICSWVLVALCHSTFALRLLIWSVRRSMIARNKKIALGSALALVPLLSLPFVLTGEYSRVSSPDGSFYAVATFPIWQRYILMMPGQSGDKSGSVAVYTADGRSCGRVPVEMVSFIRGLEWSANGAEIPLVAEWDLSKCRVHRLQ
jgi:hypothetical protein